MIVYLAGPISGQTLENAGGWRSNVRAGMRKRLWAEGSSIREMPVLISPLRGNTHEGEFGPHGEEHKTSVWKHPKAEFTRDAFDVRRCDVLLANLTGAERVSIGTMLELGMAHALHKFVIVVIPPAERSERVAGRGTTQGTNPHDHLFVYKAASMVADSLDEALDVLVAL